MIPISLSCIIRVSLFIDRVLPRPPKPIKDVSSNCLTVAIGLLSFIKTLVESSCNSFITEYGWYTNLPLLK